MLLFCKLKFGLGLEHLEIERLRISFIVLPLVYPINFKAVKCQGANHGAFQ